ncbi:MAG: AAA family ATPase [bacterium]|nr:AAA family ATPase [bacterium]
MGIPNRIAVIGNSGSGKSTLAARLARKLGAEHIELDAIHHLPDWTPIARDDMRHAVAERIETDSWVVDGNYASLVQDLVFARADTVVWLDLPRRVVMPRIIRRTVGRGLLRRELWNGNREQLRNLIKTEPAENIVLWAWTQHEKYRSRYAAAAADPANAHLEWIHITSSRQKRRWLESLSPQ